MNRNEFENYLDRVCCSLGGPEALRRHLREELREHLEEIMEDYLASGMSREEAIAKSIDTFGKPETMKEGLESVHGRRHLAFFIEKSMEWRETTMKIQWKWDFTATFFLLVSILLQVLLIMFIIVFIMPKLLDVYQQSSRHIFPALAWVWMFSKIAVHKWYLGVLLIAAGWGGFEWLIRKSENKTIIRIAGQAAVSMLIAFVSTFICVVVTVSAVMLAFPVK